MELVLSNGFCEMTLDEMEVVDGGVDWDMVFGTLAIGSGTAIGAKVGSGIGSAWPGFGTAVGGIIGGVVGVFIYTLFD